MDVTGRQALAMGVTLACLASEPASAFVAPALKVSNHAARSSTVPSMVAAAPTFTTTKSEETFSEAKVLSRGVDELGKCP